MQPTRYCDHELSPLHETGASPEERASDLRARHENEEQEQLDKRQGDSRRKPSGLGEEA